MFLYFFQDLLIAHLLGGIKLDLKVFELWGFLQVMLKFFPDDSGNCMVPDYKKASFIFFRL